MSAQSHLTGMPSVNNATASAFDRINAIIESAVPDMLVKLTAKEKKVWQHVTLALLEYGLIHKTDGITLTVVCRTFCDWVEATEQLDEFKKGNGGNYITESANGYRTAHPLYYIAKDHKKALLQWLPELALTVPSFQKIKGASIDAPQQGNLFEDPIEAFKKTKAAMGVRLVK